MNAPQDWVDTFRVVTVGKAETRHVPGLLADPPVIIEKNRFSLWKSPPMYEDVPDRPACPVLVRAERQGADLVTVATVPTLRQVLVVLGEGRACQQCKHAAERDERKGRAFHNLRTRRPPEEVKVIADAVEELAHAGDLWSAGAHAVLSWLLNGTGIEIGWDRGDVDPALTETLAKVVHRVENNPGGNPMDEHPDI